MMSIKTKGPAARWQELLDQGVLHSDPAQESAVVELQKIYDQLTAPQASGWRFFGFGKSAKPNIKGLYMYGGVGRGKSMLMDMFYDSVPLKEKCRAHFHVFMQEVHAEIRKMREKNPGDPIPLVADEIASKTKLLCFDEFQVSDIADAMLLGRLFEALFKHGITVVATSNRHPDDLYKQGLNRHLFVPFIERLKSELNVHHLADGQDYRMSLMEGKEVYFSPLNAESEKSIDEIWTGLTGIKQGDPYDLIVGTRHVMLSEAHNGCLRDGFKALCGKPLGAADYLVIAETFRIVILTGIPQLNADKRNEAKRFVTLIDTLYEAKVRFICSAAVKPEELYKKGDGSFEFERTVSRLNEMQSAEYNVEYNADHQVQIQQST